MNKSENFERELPEGYKQVKYINAKDMKLGLILNGIALAVFVAVSVSGGLKRISAISGTTSTVSLLVKEILFSCAGTVCTWITSGNVDGLIGAEHAERIVLPMIMQPNAATMVLFFIISASSECILIL